MPPKADRFARISCPRQRALARRIGDVCDLFSSRFADLEPAERLLDVSRARGDVAGKMRAGMRMFAVGAVFWLGKTLGLPNHAMHGYHAGRTEIEELKGLHYASLHNGLSSYESLCADKGEVAALVRARMETLRAAALAEVVDAAEPRSATGDWLRSMGWMWFRKRWLAPDEEVPNARK